MLNANVPCTIIQPGDFDDYGRQSEDMRISAKCGVVKLEPMSVRTSVRTDAAATRSSARETEAKVVLLIPGRYQIDLDWMIELFGYTYRVTGVFRRINVAGKLDHYEVDCDVWQISNAT